jgi:hypothetical protein
VDEKEPEEFELLEEIERRAFLELPEEDAEDAEPLDVVRLAGGEGEPAGLAIDLTLGGYIERHNRVPAFEGRDGQPYTVDVDVEATDDARAPFAAFLVFVRWAATGAGIMDHVESEDVARGGSEDEAKQGALELTLYEVKSALDAAIERKRKELEDT